MPREVRQIPPFGLIAVVWGIWWMAKGCWMPGDADPQGWFTAGSSLDASGLLVGGSRLLADLAFGRGDLDDQPHLERKCAPARRPR